LIFEIIDSNLIKKSNISEDLIWDEKICEVGMLLSKFNNEKMKSLGLVFQLLYLSNQSNSKIKKHFKEGKDIFFSENIILMVYHMLKEFKISNLWKRMYKLVEYCDIEDTTLLKYLKIVVYQKNNKTIKANKIYSELQSM
jgi:hypothetical protein